MTGRIVFSESAREDRRGITSYTVERFGVRQARRLRENFERVLITLADNPLIGAQRPELDPPKRRFRYFVVMNTFIIVYRPVGAGIEVARILNASRNLAAELVRDAGVEDEGQRR